MPISSKKHAIEDYELLKSVPVKRIRRESGGASFVASTNSVDENGISDCFHKYSTTMYVSLAPTYLHDAPHGIKSQHLDPLIMSYFPEAGGVVLAHYNLKLHRNQPNARALKHDSQEEQVVAKIMYDSPFAFLWISVDLLIWKPMPGDLVEGFINLQSPSHIGLLIHDTFNATIKRDAIPVNWKFIPNQADDTAATEELVSGQEEDNGNKVIDAVTRVPRSLGYWEDENDKKVDGTIKFTVKHFNVSSRTVSVQGTLLPPGAVREDLTQMNQTTGKNSESNKLNTASLSATIDTASTKNNHITFDDEPSTIAIDDNSKYAGSDSSLSHYEDAQDEV